MEDCLMDGTWTFLSEQNETVNGIRSLKVPAIGANEDPDIRITRTLVRLARTNGDDGIGTWFKFHGYETPNHRIVDYRLGFRHGPAAAQRQLEATEFSKNASSRGRTFSSGSASRANTRPSNPKA